MSLIKKLASETAIYGLSSILGRSINFLLVWLHSRVFMDAEYGISQKLYAVVGIAMVFFTFRMETAFFRFGTDPMARERSFSTAFTALLVATFVWLTLGFIFLQPLSAWLLLPDRTYLVAMLLAIIGFDVLAEIPFARLRLEKRPKLFAGIKLLGIMVNVVLNVVFLVWWRSFPNFKLFGQTFNTEFGVGYMFLANLLASAIVLLFLFFFLNKKNKSDKVLDENQTFDNPTKAPSVYRFDFDKTLFKQMAIYSTPLVIVGMAGVADETLDRILMERLLSGTLEDNQATLGVYSACYKLTVILALFTQAFRYAAEPFFFANAKNKDAPELYGQVAKFFTLISALGMLFVLLYLDAFKYFLGEDFRGALNAVPVVLLATLFLGVYYNFSTWYRLTDRTIWGVYIALIGLAITVVFNFLWIPTFGYMGAAYTKLLCYGAMMVVGWYFGQRYFPVNYPLGRMVLYVGLSLGLWFLAERLAESLGYSILVKMVVNSFLLLGYIGLAWKMERKNINSI
jgi:O-antigen/teichoic acid export membrane protein